MPEMAPSAKRQKRIFFSSDDEDPIAKSKARVVDLVSSSPASTGQHTSIPAGKPSGKLKPTPTRSQTRAAAANQTRNVFAPYLPTQVRRSKTSIRGASSIPEKPKRKEHVEEKGRSRDICTLFTKQAQWHQDRIPRGTAVRSKNSTQSSCELHAGDDDVISDGDDGYPNTQPSGSTQISSFVSRTVGKRIGVPEELNTNGDPPSGSQKFLKKPNPQACAEDENDLRPWAEKFAPANLEELAVHKRKVADVRAWLEGVMNGRIRQRLLLLKGAAGTGKTMTIQLLAKAMGCNVLEWRNPVGSVASTDGFISMSAQFDEFMGRGGKFGQLETCSTREEALSRAEIKSLDRRKSIILIEEFPNTFTRSSIALQSFRSCILQYVTSNTSTHSTILNGLSKDSTTPVVMIVSETLLTTSCASADSFTAHRLLGPEILHHPGVGVIEFNAIAPTLLAKALDLIVQKEFQKSGRRTTPGPLVLKKLCEIGDIRSAIGSLEFLCLRSDVNGDWGAKVAFKKTKKASKDIDSTRTEVQTLELVTLRETSLGIFHAVGKVVYNKRDTGLPPQFPAGKDPEQLAEFMSIHSRPRRSEVSINELIDETGTDIKTFLAALHENYILSCNAPPSSYEFSSLDHVNGCIGALSDSDLLYPSWNGSINSTGFSGATSSDLLRQDEISFQVAVRGLLFSLPSPVYRKATVAGKLRASKTTDPYRIFYPTSLKLWRIKEEIEGTIDLWISRLIKGNREIASSFNIGSVSSASAELGTVVSWKNTMPSTSSNPQSDRPETDHITPLISVGSSAREEMVLERLPYMVIIARSKRTTASPLFISEMESVTSFNGIGQPSENASDDENDDDTTGEQWATDKPFEGKSPKKGALVIRSRGATGTLSIHQPVQKLVLSDDDIEDY